MTIAAARVLAAAFSFHPIAHTIMSLCVIERSRHVMPALECAVAGI